MFLKLIFVLWFNYRSIHIPHSNRNLSLTSCTLFLKLRETNRSSLSTTFVLTIWINSWHFSTSSNWFQYLVMEEIWYISFSLNRFLSLGSKLSRLLLLFFHHISIRHKFNWPTSLYRYHIIAWLGKLAL